jgi:hypothetical protein
MANLEQLYLKALKQAVKKHRSSGGGRLVGEARKKIKSTAKRSAIAKAARARMSSDNTDMDRIAKLFSLPTSEDLMNYESDIYHYAYNQALKDGESEEEAEKTALKAEEEEQTENYHKWYDAVEHVADKFFGEHGLKVIRRRNGKDNRPFDLKLVPEKSWTDAAEKIRETINGVGYFHFDTLKELLDSGPYTAREAVLNHIGYVPQWSEVYGEGSPRSMYDRYMR